MSRGRRESRDLGDQAVANRACVGSLLLLLAGASCAGAEIVGRPFELERVNQKLAGRVLDYTDNHGADRRIWCPALGEARDVYVYVPPGFRCCQRYPVMLWLNGFMQDELSFLQGVVQLIDGAIQDGVLPPMIVIAPDGSIRGRASLLSAGSFYINSRAGNFEDYIIQDVWSFALSHFPIRPEREAHVIAGASMGGFGSYNLAFKYPELFGVVLGIFPPLNLRWVDCHGRYLANFDPDCWGWRTESIPGREVIGRFYGGLVRVHARRLINPLFGRGPEVVASLARENPIEMLDAHGIQPGMFEMFVAYGGKDQFNIDAQVESFLYHARQRGFCIGVAYDPRGRHNKATAVRLFTEVARWLGARLAAYGPVSAVPGAPCTSAP